MGAGLSVGYKSMAAPTEFDYVDRMSTTDNTGEESLSQLIDCARQTDVLNAYQYINPPAATLDLPKTIRFFMRDRPAEDLGKAIHNQFSLVVALETAGAVLIDNALVRLNPGQALLVFPNQIHTYMNVEDSNVFWLFCGFTWQGGERLETLRNQPIDLNMSLTHDLKECLQLCFNHGSQQKGDQEEVALQISLRFRLVLDQLRVQYMTTRMHIGDRQAHVSAYPLIAKTCKFITQHLASSIHIEDIASELHVSPGHLRNEFYRRAGCSLGKYIRYIKMHHACILLDTTDLPLAEIGGRCGYGSIYAFSRAFKKEKGVSPSQFRSQYCQSLR